MNRSLARILLAGSAFAQLPLAFAQLPLDPLAHPAAASASALVDPTLAPGAAFLFELEAKFARDVAQGGGKAFASWFAPDAVTLGDARPTVTGSTAIAASADWKPEDYHLAWTPEGGRMSPGGDMGFTWGHYTGTSRDVQGNPVAKEGRYMTIWKRMPEGSWKVILDASNNEPTGAGECCKVQ